jgi:hypothetical protein
MLSPRFWTLLALVALAAATRLIPPLVADWIPLWNFTAVGALCLFGGAYFRRLWAAFAVPMAALLASDLALAATFYGWRGIKVISVSYVLFALTTLLGMALRGRVTFASVTGASVASAVVFFLVSNYYVWLTSLERYPHTPAGLLECYVAGLPFAVNMLAGNLFYGGLLFGGYEWLTRKWPVLRERAAVGATL